MKINRHYEYIIIGSGFGGAFAAYNLAMAGKEVLIVERGKWVKRDDSCCDEVRLHLKNPLYRGQSRYYIDQKRGKFDETWSNETVGGMSTFYGAASFRMREEDFNGSPLFMGKGRDKNSAWPTDYNALSPYYDAAERLLGVAGVRGEDITEPPRETDYLHPPPHTLSRQPRKVWDAAVKLGLHPCRIPMAINFSGQYGKGKCILCSTCDHYLCKIEAKNDVSVVILPQAIKFGVKLIPKTLAVKINHSGRIANSIDLVNLETGERKKISCEKIIVSGGALASPHLLLVSGIDAVNQGRSIIGRYLFRHVNGVVVGVLPRKANPEKRLQKQVFIPDFYYGCLQGKRSPEGVWGMIQDISSIGRGVIKRGAPLGVKSIAAFLTDYYINLFCMAADIPQYTNRVYADSNEKDKFGMPKQLIYHRYHNRDIKARNALYREAKKILLKAGALPIYSLPIQTFSHAMGTCRMGINKSKSVVNPECRLWNFDNIYVIDASVIPTCGSVNPSLTIAALSLKASEEMIG